MSRKCARAKAAKQSDMVHCSFTIELETPYRVHPSTFKDIEVQLQSLYKKAGQRQPGDPLDEDEFFGPLEDLQEAINDYKVCSLPLHLS